MRWHDPSQRRRILQPAPCALLQQARREQLTVDRTETLQGLAVQRHHLVRQTEWHIRLPCLRGEDVELLDAAGEREISEVVAGQKQVEVLVDEGTAARPGRESTPQGARGDVHRLAEEKCLGHGNDLAEPEQVTEQLRALTGTRLFADVVNGAERFKQVVHPRNRIRRPAH